MKLFFFFNFCFQAPQKHGRAAVSQSFRERNKSTLINFINQHVCNARLTEPRWMKITTVSREDLKNNTGAKLEPIIFIVIGLLKARWEDGADVRLADEAPRPFKEASSLLGHVPSAHMRCGGGALRWLVDSCPLISTPTSERVWGWWRRWPQLYGADLFLRDGFFLWSIEPHLEIVWMW